MSNETAPQIPRATHGGKLHIGDAEFDCFVVVIDGVVERVITQASALRHLGKVPNGTEVRKNAMIPNVAILTSIAEDIRSRLPVSVASGIRRIEPLVCAHPHTNKTINGYRAEDLIEFCDLVLEADDADVLFGGQGALARRASRIIRGCARIGVAALVDEATGYQTERGPEDLRRAIDRYLAETPNEYERRFPREFFELIATLRGWRFDPSNPAAGFAYVIREYVYGRMLPGVVEAMDSMNPMDETTGLRARKHHQHLTHEDGVRVLMKHLDQLIVFARMARSWHDFVRDVDRYAPRYGTQFALSVEAA